MDRSPGGTTVHQQRFSVSFGYPVIFTEGALAPANGALRSALEPGARGRCRAFAVIDAGLAEAQPDLERAVQSYCAQHADRIELVAPPLRVPGGERVKDAAELER